MGTTPIRQQGRPLTDGELTGELTGGDVLGGNDLGERPGGERPGGGGEVLTLGHVIIV